MIIDSKNLYKKVYNIAKGIDKKEANKIVHHKLKEPIFDTFNLEDTINKMLKPKVWLKKTEAFLTFKFSSYYLFSPSDYLNL